MDKKPEKLVPEVRFKGFTDDWEQHKLGEISFKVNTKNKENLTLPVLSNSAEYGIVNQEDYFDKKIANRTDNYYIVKHNDFVYNPRISKKAPYGPIRRNTLDTKGLMSPLYYVFRINDGNYIYLDYYFKSSKWYKFMYQNGDSGARSDRFAIKDKIFQMMPISMPNTKEQNKIGQLIQTLQKLIDLQQRKLRQLKQLKMVMLQQLFVDKNNQQPNLRFKKFNGNWELHKLGDVILDYKKKNNNDLLPVLTSSFQGIEYQEKHFGSKQKHDTSDYNVLPKEYMTYRNRSDNGYFRFNINKLGIIGIVSKFYPVFTTINTNKQFLASYLNYNPRLKNYFKVVSVGTSQHVLSLKNFKKTNLLFPSKSEQDKIGDFFNLLNKIIFLQQNKLTQLTTLKKYLLQKMFI